MSDRLHEMDSTSAIFAALGSFWWRLVAFALCCFIGHYVGLNIFSAGEFLREVWALGPSAIFAQEQLNPILVPLSWLWVLVSGCSHPAALLQLLVIAVAFLVVRLSEDRFYLGFAMILLSQPIDTVFVLSQDQTLEGFDFVVGIFLLGVWELGIGGVCWWLWRQLE